MSVELLIPCKPLHSGKSRLASVLHSQERYELCKNLLLHSLGLALEVLSPLHIHLVTNDPNAQALATNLSIGVIGDDDCGLNKALSRARSEIQRSAAIAVMPIDLVLAKPDSVNAILHSNADVVIAPDRHGTGTNLLYLSARVSPSFPFTFGAGSFAAHLQAAQATGFGLRVADDPDLGFDLDSPEDWRLWRGASSASG